MNVTMARFNGFEAARLRKARVCFYRNRQERKAWFDGYDDYEERVKRFSQTMTHDFLAQAAREKAMKEVREVLGE